MGTTAHASTPIPHAVQGILRQHGLRAITHPVGSTKTAAMAAQQLGCAVGCIVNSLVFEVGDEVVLVLVGGDQRVSTHKLSRLVGARARLASASRVRQATDFSVGAVCPFMEHPIRTIINQHLQRYPLLYPAAGTDCSSVALTFRQLIDITGGQVADVAQHIEHAE